MKYMVLLLSSLMVLSLGAQAGELYQWVGEDGRVHYSDTPPADATKAVRKKLGRNVEANEDISYEARRAQQNFPVTLYVGESCVEPCALARALLRKRGIPYSEKLLKTKDEIDEFHKLSGSNDSPTLAVGKTYLGGFFESKWSSELDVAGYPKTATYRQQIAPPKPAATDTELSGEPLIQDEMVEQ